MNRGEARFVAGVARPDGYPAPVGPEVVFAGRSNVDKSSLLNALLRRRRLARVSRTPGRTQQVNFFTTPDLGVFVDLPGYGFARVPESVRRSWKALVEGYLRAERPVAICLLLVDARHDPTELDVTMRHWLRSTRLSHRVVLTKSDAVGGGDLSRAIQRAARRLDLDLDDSDEAPLPASARTGRGIPQVRALIHRAVNS